MPERLDWITVTTHRGPVALPWGSRQELLAEIDHLDPAAGIGLPAVVADVASEQWERIWRLWAKYFAMGPPRVYEGVQASVIMNWPTGSS